VKLKRRKSNGIWLLDFKDQSGKRQRVSTGESDRARAEDRAREIMAGKVKPGKITKYTLAAALSDTFERRWAKQASHREKLYVANAIGRSRLGYMDVSDITYRVLVAEVADWLGDEESGISPATCNRRLATIHTALTEAHAEGLLAVVPKMPHQQEDNLQYRWLTREEELSILQTCGKVMVEDEANLMRALITALVDTGGRLTETVRCALEGKFSATQAVFSNRKSKGGKLKSRSVPLTPRAHDALKALQRWQAEHGELDKDWCGRKFTLVRDRLDMPDVHLHTLRHTCLSRLVQGGMDLYRVKEWAGHSSIVVTERYAHLAPSNLLDGAAILSAVQQPNLRSVK
jgi:integrase